MYPKLFELKLPFELPIIGDIITLHTYSFFAALGFIFALLLLSYRLKKSDIDSKKMEDTVFYSVLIGIIGARIFYVIINWEQYSSDFISIFKVWEGGIVFYGGAVSGFIAGILIGKIKKIDVLKGLDIMAPCMSLGHAFGRIGCHMFGCCFGKTCSADFISVRFPQGSPAFEKHIHEHIIGFNELASAPVIPSQIISALFLFLLTVFLIIIEKKISRKGFLFFIYVMIYSVFRFIIEFFRDEYAEFYLMNLTYSQYISIILFIISAVFFMKKGFKNE